MLEKTIPFVRLTVSPLIGLGGALAQTPTANAVLDEDPEAPVALNKRDAVEADAQRPVAVMPTLESTFMPTFSDAKASQQEPKAAGLLTLEPPTGVEVGAPELATVTPMPDAAALATVADVEETLLKPKVDVRLTLEQLLADDDAPALSLDETPAIAPENPISHRAADLELQDGASLANPSSQADATLEPPLLAQEVDRETLCRSFPLNSRCREPVETEVAPQEPMEPATPEAESAAEVSSNLIERDNGLYLSVFGALQGRADAEDFLGRASFSTGFGLGGALGYRLDDFRIEAEIGYFRNDFDELTFFLPGTTTPVPGPSETSPGAYVEGRTLMANVYYDIPIRGSRLKPYIGAGVGIYSADIVDLAPPSFFGFTANGNSPDRFAFQLRAGLAYAVSQNLDIFLGYRYFKGNRFEYTIENSGTPPLVLRPNGLESNNLELGLRYNF